MAPRTNHRGWIVLESIASADGSSCVDVFEDAAGSYGFEQLRADPEDGGAWTAVGGFGGTRFPSPALAAEAALDAISWLNRDDIRGTLVAMAEHTDIAEEFEAGTLDHCDFGHAEHVRVIWTLVTKYGTLEALRRFEEGLRRITEAAGHPEKYHATITHVFGFLVGERVARQNAADWDQFIESNPDLLEWPNPILHRMYDADVLHSDEARRTFVLPSG
ncbi:MAG: hypothetical protein ACR2P0_10020 [Acidimicrobiales bacterium]